MDQTNKRRLEKRESYKFQEQIEKQKMDTLFQNILLHNKKIIAAAIILLIPSIYFAGKINLDSSTEIFLVDKDPAKQAYDNFIHDFGSDEILLVMITTDLNTFFNSPLPDQLTEKFNNIPGVTAVYNPLDKYRNALTENNAGINIEKLKKKVAQNPFEKKGSMLSFEENYVVYALKIISITANQRGSVFKETQEILKSYGLDMNSVKIAGQPVLNYYLSETPKEVGNIFFPLLVITSVLVLYYIFRDIHLITAPILLIISVQLFVLGFIGLTGKTLNIITTIVPVILYIITLAASIHLLEHLVTNRRKGERQGPQPNGLPPGTLTKSFSALHKALYKQKLTAPEKNKVLQSNSITDDLLQMMKNKFAPCMFAAFTTAVGFGSLSFSPLAPIKSLGIYLSFGTIFSFVLLYTLFPSILLLFLKKGRLPQHLH